MAIVNEMFALAAVGPGDFLIDLGSGDGRIVITAAKRFGARGRGVDLNPKLVALSQKYALAEGVADRTEFLVQDIFLTDIRAADVVTIIFGSCPPESPAAGAGASTCGVKSRNS